MAAGLCLAAVVRRIYSALVSSAVADCASPAGGTCFTTLATLVSVSTEAFTCLWPAHSADAAEIESPIAAAIKRIVFFVGSFVFTPKGG